MAQGRRLVSPEVRNSASTSKDEVRCSAAVSADFDGVPELDPLIFDPYWWPVKLGTTKESGLVLLEVFVGLSPGKNTGSLSGKAY